MGLNRALDMARPGRVSMGSCIATATLVEQNFLGQEVVWKDDVPLWAMNYHGYILRPDLIDAQRAGATIQSALQAMYDEGRFLGGFEWSGPHGTYRDSSTGDPTHFRGHACIAVAGVKAYGLSYLGGLIKP
jgi:hypothetical protein